MNFTTRSTCFVAANNGVRGKKQGLEEKGKKEVKKRRQKEGIKRQANIKPHACRKLV
jgi:hypothetical protein